MLRHISSLESRFHSTKISAEIICRNLDDKDEAVLPKQQNHLNNMMSILTNVCEI